MDTTAAWAARRARDRERRAARKPARRSARASALGLHAAGLRGRPDRLRAPGLHRRARDVAKPRRVPADLPRAARRGGHRRTGRLRRRLDVRWWLAVRRLERERPLPHLHLRRDRPVRGRALRLERLSRRGRKVERRSGCRRHRDAAAGPLRRLREPRRRRPLRSLDPAVLPTRRATVAGCVRRLDRALSRGVAHGTGSAGASARPPHPAPVGLLGRVLRRRGRDDPPALRRHDRPGDPGAVGALARMGLPDPRAAARRGAPRDARRLHRCGNP